ncbi:MAG: hypothetical protein IJA97_01470 [Clostridia bacterium]|nr:hypothetical protein [Clostridia bacterium]
MFFKKKLKGEVIDKAMLEAVNNWDMPGLPAPSERNDDNWQVELSSSKTSRGVKVSGTVNDITLKISVYHTLKTGRLQTYISINNLIFDKKYDEQRELKKKYPNVNFSFLENLTFVEFMRYENGTKVFDTKTAKTVDELKDRLQEICDDFTYTGLYNTAIELNNKRTGE